jgi:hypothetical protein
MMIQKTRNKIIRTRIRRYIYTVYIYIIEYIMSTSGSTRKDDGNPTKGSKPSSQDHDYEKVAGSGGTLLASMVSIMTSTNNPSTMAASSSSNTNMTGRTQCA